MDRSHRTHLFLLCLVLAVLVGTIVFTFWNKNAQDGNQPAPPENRDQVRQEIQAAFNDPNAVANAPKEFENLLDRMGTELRAGGGNADQLFNVERMAQAVDRDGALARMGGGPKNPASVRGMQGAMKKALPQMADVLAWDRSEIRGVKWLIPGKECVIITRHFAKDEVEEEISFKMRWWIVNGPDGWKFFDMEDVALGDRFTAMMASFLHGLRPNDFAQLERLKKLTQEVMAAKQALMRHEYKQAHEMIHLPPPPGTPPLIEGMMYLWSAIALIELNRPQEGLDALARVEALIVDVPVVHFLKAAAFNQLAEYEKAEAEAARYMEFVGVEAAACLQRGFALEQLQRQGEALEAFRRGLDDEPANRDCLSGLRRCLPADMKAEFAERFFKLRKPNEQFAFFVNEALGDEDFEGANALIAAYAGRFPKDPEAIYQEARVKSRLKKPDEAKALFLKAIGQADKDRRTNYLYGYLGEMESAKLAFDAYDSLADADARLAFRFFADGWIDRLGEVDDDDRGVFEKDLKQLIVVHRKRKPDDSWPTYFEAHLHFDKKQYADVERLLSSIADHAFEEHERTRIDWLRVEALYQDGKAMTAYRKVGKRQKTFRQLADAMSRNKDLDGIETLLKTHREAEPADRAIGYFEGDLLFLREKYAEAVQSFRAYDAALKKDEDDDYVWRVNDQIVRCLIRLKRFDEARKELEARMLNNQWALLPLAIEAAAGNVAKVEMLLAERLKDGGWTGHFYADADLGPALRSDKFSKVREKYPPPKDDRPLKKT